MVKTITAMQPYLFPYLGYFQLIAAADVFVLSDDLQYIHQGWVNRNKILIQGKGKYIHFPLKKASHVLNINERFFSDGFSYEMDKLLKGISHAYARAPFFKEVFPLLKSIINCPENNLARYAENSLKRICDYLHIATLIVPSSQFGLAADLGAQQRVIDTVKKLKGTIYINPIGGAHLYHAEDFRRHGITLKFHQMNDMRYRQFDNEFTPCLSIIDVLMFNGRDAVQKQLSAYSLSLPEDFMPCYRHELFPA